MSRNGMTGLRGSMALGVLAGLACGSALGDRVGVAMVTIEGAILGQPGPFAWLTASGEPSTMDDYLSLLDAARDSEETDAVVIRLKDATIGVTQIQELAQGIRRLRDAGKGVHVFAENYGTSEILLAAQADSALIQTGGAVSFPGLYMEEMFLADTFAWLGITPDFVQIGDYKGANEMYMNSEPSPAWDANISQLLDSMYANMLEMVGDGRGLSNAEVERAMGDLWWASADRAIELGMIDAQVDLPELQTYLGDRLDGEVEWVEDLGEFAGTSRADMMSNPFAMLRMLTEVPSHRPKGDTIAVLHVQGAIVDGDSSAGGMFGGQTTGSRTIRNAIEDILKEDEIGGVVVRIDSPGGSAIASEVIWQGLRRLSNEKPVWVSVGSMAASGGYYIAVGGDRIYVNPSSIVGSIGVVGGKLAMGGLMDKARIRITPRSRGPMAAMMSTTTPWSEAERGLIRDRMGETYDLFASRVAEGREGIDLSKTAEGRLFTGDKAIGLKMADEIGSLEDAIADMGEELGWSDFDVMHYPGPKSFDELIEEMLGGFVRAPGVGGSTGGRSALLEELARALARVIGERAWASISAQMEAMSVLRDEPIVLTMPRALIVR